MRPVTETAIAICLVVSVGNMGCGDDDGPSAIDSGVAMDAARSDAGRSDSGPSGVDGGPSDASASDAPTNDASSRDAGVCTRNDECADGLFCNGAELCGRDGICVAGAVPCSSLSAPGTCNEEFDFCDASCPTRVPAHHLPGHSCPPSPPCSSDADCDDHDPCTGLALCLTPGFFGADSCGCYQTGVVTTCASAAECDDGVFCNGVEGCGSSACSACVPATAGPCSAGQDCDEAGRRCTTRGCTDTDGDGHRNAAPGCGDDCDDDDAARFPGRMEVCDATGHDEDCDPMTFGFRDADGDTWGDGACCNTGAGGVLNCGPDCNDAAPAVSPVGAETCNGADEDCDGDVDEGLRVFLYSDLDGDGHGNGNCGALGCPGSAGSTAVADDCDDTNPALFRGSQICGAMGGIRRCVSDPDSGAFSFSTETPCPGGADCRPQPDGTGLCL